MNWFQKLWNNPNVHIIGALASGAASVAFPAYAGALQILAGALGTAGVVLPESPNQTVLKDSVPVPATPAAPPPPVVNLPPAAGGGSYHAVDYANLAAALIQQFAAKQPDPPARS